MKFICNSFLLSHLISISNVALCLAFTWNFNNHLQDSLHFNQVYIYRCADVLDIRHCYCRAKTIKSTDWKDGNLFKMFILFALHFEKLHHRMIYINVQNLYQSNHESQFSKWPRKCVKRTWWECMVSLERWAGGNAHWTEMSQTNKKMLKSK